MQRNKTEQKIEQAETQEKTTASQSDDKPIEKGGPKGPEPTRYGDWEMNGKCVDF